MTAASHPPSAEEPEPSDPLVGTVVAGRYRVRERLGEGGMGLVYFAEHEAIEKPVALKVLKAEYSTRPDMVERFQREAISASRIVHPHLLEVFDFGKLDDGRFFLAMERLEGEDLAEVLAREGALDPARAVRIALPICRALDAAHAKGVVHRDLKPENVFLHRAGGETVVKVVDFGVALLHDPGEPLRRRLTKTGMVFGTWEYMSPEQASGAPADSRTDIYALGIIAYEMCAGRVPFVGDGFLEIANAHVKSPPPPMRTLFPGLTISDELEAAILRALEKHPEMRYDSMAAFAEAIAATPEARAEREATAPPKSMPSVSGIAIVTAEEVAEPREPRASTPSSEAPTREARAADEATERADDPPSESTVPSKRVPVLAAAGVAVVALVALVSSIAGSKRSTSGVALVASAPPVRAPLLEDVPPPPPVSTFDASSLRLHVTTHPTGATILKNGSPVCTSSPCDVEAIPNEALVLTAEKEGLLGKTSLVADRERDVDIELAKTGPEAKGALAARGRGPSTTAPGRDAGGAECGWDLKKLRIVGPCTPPKR